MPCRLASSASGAMPRMPVCSRARISFLSNRFLYGALALALALLPATASSLAAAATDGVDGGEGAWFTVAGDARQPQAETLQVDPVAIKVEGDFKTMKVRVSRALERHNWSEVPYRSYEARVLFDCRSRRAFYLDATYFQEPMWQGKPHHVEDYMRDPKPVLFKGMEPNPTERVIRAACR
jgi:hypothetical protein